MSTSDDNDAPECAICCEPRHHCSLRPCGHSICTTCVARLLVCPMCRATIMSTVPHVERDTYSLRHAAREEQDMHELREAAAHRVPALSYSGRRTLNQPRHAIHRHRRHRRYRRHRRNRRHRRHRRTPAYRRR